ncbi:hypothetical protein ACGFX7_06355 [Streptomyces harbinensis]|uniref:hypothetical protein n=1 Tax=Streptomyces harbinensis TaxID=1176198 RepID=UPI00370FF0D0
MSEETSAGVRDLSLHMTVEWHAETRQPDGTWEQSSSVQPERHEAVRCLAGLARRWPDDAHRLRRRTTTVMTETVPSSVATPSTPTSGQQRGVQEADGDSQM